MAYRGSDLRATRRELNTTRDLQTKGWYHSILLPDGRLLEGTQSLERLQRRIAGYPLPSDLRGKRVLDIGAWDGWFSFEMERRGASVVAVDCVDLENFRYAHRKLRSRVEYLQLDIYDLTPSRVGRFDIVLCLGVIYHLKHPLLALERVCDLTTDLAIVESFVADDVSAHTEYPWMEFYETDELGGQADNWTGPNIECLLALSRTAGFARVEFLSSAEHRAAVACYRKWAAATEPATSPAPRILQVLNSQNAGINFDTRRDEYTSIWFSSPETGLGRDSVFPEVCGYGVKPISVACSNSLWQANFKLPPGLAPGWQPVRVRTASSPWSAPMKVAIDMPAVAGTIVIRGACDGVNWAPNETSLTSGRITFWVRGLAGNADLNNVQVFLGEAHLRPDYLEQDQGQAERQMNACLPRTMEPGTAGLFVRFGGVESNRCTMLVKE